MKNKLIILLLATVLILSAFTSCTYIPKVSYNTVTRITLEAGASVEFIVNRENDVVAVTPLNDEACVLLINEDLLKIAPDKAADKFMTLVLKSGFNGDKVKLSISGESDYVDVITEMIQKKIQKRLKKFSVNASIEMVEPATVFQLRDIMLDDKLYNELEMSIIGDSELIYYLALSRQETAALPSLPLKKLYYAAKELNVEIYTAEGKLGVLETIKTEYPEAYEVYNEAFNMLKESAAALENAAKELYLGNSTEAIDSYYSDFEAKKVALTSIEEAFQKEVTVAIRKAYYETQTALISKRNSFPFTFKEKYQSEIDATTSELVARKNELIK